MLKIKVQFLLLQIVLSLTGCFPVQYTDIQGASGTVVDQKTYKPISGAHVVLTPSKLSDPKGKSEVVTNDKGEFLIKPKKKWGIYIIPMDPYYFDVEISINAKGYKPTTKVHRAYSTGPAQMKFGEIQLERE